MTNSNGSIYLTLVDSLLVPFITGWRAKKLGCPKFPKEGRTFRGWST